MSKNSIHFVRSTAPRLEEYTDTMESVAPAAKTARWGWKARQLTGPMRWPMKPWWYLMVLSTIPSRVITLMNCA